MSFLTATPTYAADPELRLIVPEQDEPNPELSIVIPAMNERITIGDFVDWCKDGLRKAGIAGEILIVDSSMDETPQIAVAHGARVLKAPKRGLGRAYIDSIPFVRGKYILMGDADCTYDFREFSGFVEKFRAGYEYVMGSRFKGYIEPNAMPPLHRYFGTPFTTWILNRLYSTKFSDIHCGMRGITKEALIRINLESQSWEYASEMVLKSVCLKLRTAEVPVRFLRDREGRLSHMKRGGWMEPWRAGWINLRAMLIYGADFFLIRPGLVLLIVGLLLSVPVIGGPVSIGPVTLSLYWMLLGVTLGAIGAQSYALGCIVQVIYQYTEDAVARRIAQFSYDRAMVVSGLALAGGILLGLPLVIEYISHGLRLPAAASVNTHMAVMGLFIAMLSFIAFSSTLVIHAADLRVKRRQRAPTTTEASA
jgi:glycosyltransferase involved in cell wall biosynthesis